MKFTFKLHSRTTGLAGVAHPWQDSDIKLKGAVVGLISHQSVHAATHPDGPWSVRIMVKATAENATAIHAGENDVRVGWKWITFKSRFKEDTHAKAWVSSGKVADFVTRHNLELHANSN